MCVHLQDLRRAGSECVTVFYRSVADRIYLHVNILFIIIILRFSFSRGVKLVSSQRTIGLIYVTFIGNKWDFTVLLLYHTGHESMLP